MEKESINEKWRERFDFLSTHGLPGTPSYTKTYRTMKFGQRVSIGANLYAFFFGFVYFCILGLWKKGLVLFLGVAAIQAALIAIETVANIDMNAFAKVINIGYACVCSYLVNTAYYLRMVKGVESWNPFQGLTRKSAEAVANLPSRQY